MKHKIKILMMACAMILNIAIATQTQAATAQTPNIETEIKVTENQMVIIVNGIVCYFCSKGVRRNLSKLDFIDQSQYNQGVKVEIEIQKLTIAIKPDMTADLNAIYEAIKSGGYEPVKAVFADGKTHIFEGA